MSYKSKNKSILPYLIIDTVLQDAELIRMPLKPSETPEFRLNIKDLKKVVVKIRKLIKKVEENG